MRRRNEQSPSPPAWLRDEVFDCYLRWCEACAAGRAAYEGWRQAAREDRALAFAAFRASLDREERAAVVYAELVARATTRGALAA